MRAIAIVGALWLGACGGGAGGPAALDGEEIAAEVAVARQGCVRCHPAPASVAPRVRPIAGPALAGAALWSGADGGEGFLRAHHGGEAAKDLAAWVVSLPPLAAAVLPTPVAPATIERGDRLWRELACQACHAPSAFADLAGRVDHARLAAFLVAPVGHRPTAVHVQVPPEDAGALAAWLLRDQASASADIAVPGFAYECFELTIGSAALPTLDGLQPTARGLAPRLDASFGTRPDHFALRFTAELTVPETGEWTFTCGSDDGSWLWIDDVLIVRNEALAPHRRRHGKVRLTAGRHALRVVYSEAAGEQSLEVLWQGPGTEQQPIPASAATASSRALVPPPPPRAPDPAAVARGRAQAIARRCASCHATDEADVAAAANLAPSARPFAELGDGDCPQQPGAAAIAAAARRAFGKPHGAQEHLSHAMAADGCLACHRRDGRGGLPPVVAQGLAEVEDLGDEGRLPPDLTGVGRRLRPVWLQKVLAEGHKARRYLKLRMPALPTARAAEYAGWFAAVDGRPGDADEPPFSAAQVELGRQLVGVGGKNCITCHAFAGHRALGPQGMDLVVQYERLQPAYFREWLLQPLRLRPHTRMPMLWVGDEPGHRQEVDAVRALLSLGASAPLPNGLAGPAGGLVLSPRDRPILHGAFLQGLSARCVAVGSPLRTHYAYDVEHARLAWLWRGGFVDADGTWSGRAGQLLRPLGEDHVVLDDLAFADEPDPPSGPSSYRAVVGRTLDADGYPIWRVMTGAAEFEDHIRPRLAAGGTEIVRTLRVVSGTLQVAVPAKRGRVNLTCTPAGAGTLQPGQTLEIVYRW
jgi:hypothetical protein